MGELLRRRLGLVLVVLVLVVLTSASRLASLAVDWWWFGAVDYREVFTTVLTSRLLLGGVGAVLLGGLVAANLLVARRLRPLFVPSTPQQAQVERYREMADPYLPWLIAAVAVLFGVSSGLALSTEWEALLLFQNGGSFGIDDPQFGRDVGFYVFQLPFLKLVQEWLLTSLVLTTLLTVGAHYLLGGIRPENPGEKVMPNVKAHLSALFALVLAAWGWGYYLDRFLLNFSPRGTVTGASYTDVNAELPALNLLLVVSVVAIGLVIYNVRQRGFLLPGAAVGLMVLASVFLQGAYPAAIQRFQVEPQELERERDFIDRNLEATRAAYDLADVPLRPFDIENDLDADQARDNQVTLENVRLWDPEVLSTTYAELQALRPYYQFNDVDVDRYTIDGEVRQVMLSTRDLNLADLPSQSWQNRTLTFTHGYGVVASQVNTATAQQQPVFLVSDIPPRGSADPLVPTEQPGIYYGENTPTYNIVNTDNPELDYERPDTQEQVFTSYAGDGGVQLSSLLRRAAFAVEFADTNILLSGLIRDDSKILIRRDVAERVQAVAPFLELDADPYPVVFEGRVKYVQDAYTTSAFYPYSERRFFAQRSGAPVVNYVRNSVKAVVDAYDGTVELFVIDDEDPVIAAWRETFPDVFRDGDEAPAGIEAHYRYPEDLFTLQADVYATYHIPGVEAFYNKADEWDIPPDAAAAQNAGGTAGGSTLLEPYYLLMRLPGEVDEEFVLIQPYLANERPNMVAWLAARSDPEHYGELVAVQFPSDSQVLGTSQVQTRIEQDDDISEYITLRSEAGSTVRRGNMIVLPVDESIVYVEPLFLEGGQSRIPELARVVLVMGDRVVFERTLEEAIASLVGADIDVSAPIGDPDPGDDGDGGDGGATDDDVEDQLTPDGLLLDALEAFAEAQAALERGDLGTYQRLVEEARDLVEQSAESDGLPLPGDEPTPEPTPDEAPADGDDA